MLDRTADAVLHRIEPGLNPTRGACYAPSMSADAKWIVGTGTGIVAVILATGVGLAGLIVSQHAGIYARMDSFDARMDRIEDRMDRIEDRLDGFDERLRAVEVSFGKVDQRLLTLERAIIPAAPPAD